MTSLRYRDPLDTNNPEEVNVNRPLPVNDMSGKGVVSVILPQVAPGTSTPVLLCPQNPLRRSVKITNTTGTQVVWIGTNANVSSTTGDYLAASAGSNNVYWGSSALYGLSVTAAQTLAIVEDRFSA